MPVTVSLSDIHWSVVLLVVFEISDAAVVCYS
jgi:hypothetical protein